MRAFVFVVVPFTMVLGACSGAESETPVDLKPGQYEIVVAGLGGQGETKSRCLSPEEAANFTNEPAKQFMIDGNNCEGEGHRKGNALTGNMSCRIENADATADLTVNWTGRMHADGFELQGDAVLKDANAPEGSALHRGTITLTGKRTGESFS